MLTQNLGYPRIGANRELKKACEAYWKGSISLNELEQAGKQERLKNWKTQQQSGIDWIPSNDFSFYDQVVDWCFMFGVIPRRFKPLVENMQQRDLYFALCRGYQDDVYNIAPLEMTKWFDTNYHYLVPEFEENQSFTLSDSKVIDEYLEASSLGIQTKPVLIGPMTFLKLGKFKSDKITLQNMIHNLLPVYIQLIGRLEKQGVKTIQIDEPFLVTELEETEKQLYHFVFNELFGSFPGLTFVLATYFGGVTHNLDLIARFPLEVLHLDLVRDKAQLEGVLDAIPETMSLSLGLVDGRNIWKNELEASLKLIRHVVDKIGQERVLLSPSCSLLHVPYDLSNEAKDKGLPGEVMSWMAFAHQKLDEVVLLSKLSGESITANESALLDDNRRTMAEREQAHIVHDLNVQKALDALPENREEIRRNRPFSERVEMQQRKFNLPLFPATLIGSLPQTKELRAIRRQFLNREIDDMVYFSFIENQLVEAIKWQEELGLDVLVHGEFERNDMVEYFGERLNGFAFTQNGWVQSYGSRAVKPPVIYGDVSRKAPMTVAWTSFAQKQTAKPVKGMLTGPVTLLQWSFVRDDQPRETTATQLALAVRDEVLDLEQLGIGIIQIDEPAFREGLPLLKKEQKHYLDWAVQVFRLSSWGVKDETQIHTHMCYSEFNEIMPAIAAMDADVISIEASRSQMELLTIFRTSSYPNHVGPGIYDIHSPRVPSVEELCDLLYVASKIIPVKSIWVNPDCGLKTRGWAETKLAIKHLMEATFRLRGAVPIK